MPSTCPRCGREIATGGGFSVGEDRKDALCRGNCEPVPPPAEPKPAKPLSNVPSSLEERVTILEQGWGKMRNAVCFYGRLAGVFIFLWMVQMGHYLGREIFGYPGAHVLPFWILGGFFGLISYVIVAHGQASGIPVIVSTEKPEEDGQAID